MHIYERELTGANALVMPSGASRVLFPIGFPPTGRMLKLVVRQAQASIDAEEAMDAFTARLYDRDWGLLTPAVTYTPTLSVGGVVVAHAGTFTISNTAGLPTSGYFFGDVRWTRGGRSYTSQNIVFESQSGGTVLDVEVLGTSGTALPLTDGNLYTGYDPGSMQIYYLPQASATAYGPSRMEVILDENVTNGTTLASAGGATPAWYSSGTGMPYQNREGSFSVPVRKVYLEIDLGLETTTHAYQLEVELACKLGNEQN